MSCLVVDALPPMSVRSDVSVVIVTPHPRLSSPTTFAAGMRTSSKKTSLKWAMPVIWRSGRISMPGVRMSTRK